MNFKTQLISDPQNDTHTALNCIEPAQSERGKQINKKNRQIAIEIEQHKQVLTAAQFFKPKQRPIEKCIGDGWVGV